MSDVLEILLDVVSAALLLSGSVLTLLAAIGLFRMPDAYARIHVSTKPATLGITCTLSGAALQLTGVSDATKLLLALAFQLLTVPASSHLLARAGRLRGLAPARTDVVDAFDGGREGGSDDGSGTVAGRTGRVTRGGAGGAPAPATTIAATSDERSDERGDEGAR